jgi:hypothetical protein
MMRQAGAPSRPDRRAREARFRSRQGAERVDGSEAISVPPRLRPGGGDCFVALRTPRNDVSASIGAGLTV